MYIAPNTTIKILRSVPLDPGYENTIYFETTTAGRVNQTSYFSSKSKYTLDYNSYQRVNKNKIRVNILSDNLYDCNYLMFQNTSFGSKWFYAFIKSVEYINNAVSEIEYEIDVMQTWHFDYTLNHCYVSREHSSTDHYFENTVAENFDLGSEYLCVNHETYDLNDMSVYVLSSLDGQTVPLVINDVYVPAQVSGPYHLNDQTDVNNLTSQLRALNQSVICVFELPTELTLQTAGGEPLTPFVATVRFPVAFGGGVDANNNPTGDYYIPKNRKLFSYPYINLTVSNNAGQAGEYKWEYFRSASLNPDYRLASFEIDGVELTTPAAICYPTAYRGIEKSYDEGILMANFPTCAWNNDVFKKWWSENKNSYVTSGISSVLSTMTNTGVGVAASLALYSNPATAATLATGQVIAGTVSVANKIANDVAKIQDIKAIPPQIHGQLQTDCLNNHLNRVRYDFYSLTIKPEIAKIIDAYFDKFGYATKKVKIPNRAVRPYWTYTQTEGCTINGNLPADDEAKICSIYDKGITFWLKRSGEDPNVGNYSLNNSIPEGGG